MALPKKPGTTIPTAKDEVGSRDAATVYTHEPKDIFRIELEGDPWEVTWYSQVLGKMDTPRRLDLGLSPTLQSYLRVNEFIILQTEELSQSTDENQITTITGAASIYPTIVPNLMDHFVARMSDGSVGLFVIKTVERAKYYQYTAWDITYELMDYHNETYQANLDLKTIDTWYYNPDDPLNATRGSSNRQEKVNVAQTLSELLSWWMDDFYDHRTSTAILPGTDLTSELYDGSVVEFMKTIVPRDMWGHRPNLNLYTTATGEYRGTVQTVWDVMVDGEDTAFHRIRTHYGTTTVSAFASDYIYTALALNALGGIILPTKGDGTFGNGPLAEGYYVFSEAFYTQDVENQTPLEKLVWQGIRREAYSLDDVKAVLDTYKVADVTPQVRFYALPALIWLLLRLY